ncbi:hypothetical protein CDAR_213231 [Caerostris darwini]|uniref:Uncharacterized protein n=1 Tax=Caerostris darwini TaxID=1538125 RepID=A0AAV4PY81_9ARAC|nr:hypothetical protein CDAR_213231 [Caerostris darwini]
MEQDTHSFTYCVAADIHRKAEMGGKNPIRNDLVRLLLKQSTSLQGNTFKRSRTCIVLLTELQVRWARRARKKSGDGSLSSSGIRARRLGALCGSPLASSESLGPKR